MPVFSAVGAGKFPAGQPLQQGQGVAPGSEVRRGARDDDAVPVAVTQSGMAVAGVAVEAETQLLGLGEELG